MLPVKKTLLPTVSRFFDDDWYSLFDWSNRNFPDSSTSIPSVNIKHDENEYIVEIAAPGMKKSDFEIALDNTTLTIKSHLKKDEDHNTTQQYLRKEFNYEAFQRSFTLNNELIDENNISANYKDGILTIILPKKEEAKPKPSRIIKIS